MVSHWISAPPDRSAHRVAKDTVHQRTQVVRDLIRKLKRVTDEPTPHSAQRIELVHDLRVACRRAEAAIQFFGPLLVRKPTRRVRKLLRKVRRTAGKLRECDILYEHVDRLPSESLKHVLLDRLTRARRKAYLRVRRSVRKLFWSGRFWKKAKQIRPRKRTERIGYLIWAAQRSLARIEKLSDSMASDPNSSQEWHRVRILAKRFRYTSEFVAALAAPVAEIYPLVEQLQEHLGQLNDVAIRHRWLLSQEKYIPAVLEPAWANCVEQSRILETELLKQVERFVETNQFKARLDKLLLQLRRELCAVSARLHKPSVFYGQLG